MFRPQVPFGMGSYASRSLAHVARHGQAAIVKALPANHHRGPRRKLRDFAFCYPLRHPEAGFAINSRLKISR
jgi:hypothetical protein